MATYTSKDAQTKAVSIDPKLFQLFDPMGHRFIRWVAKAEKQPDGSIKWRKPPYQIGSNNLAKTDNPATWSTFAKALELADAQRRIGLCLKTLPGDRVRLVSLDPDYSRSKATGEPAEWVRKYVENPPSYMEASPSRTGYKLIGTVPLHFPLPANKKVKVDAPVPEGSDLGIHDGPGWELLVENRYTTLSLDPVPGSPLELRDLSAVIAELFGGATQATATGRPSPSAADDAQYERDAADAPPPEDDRRWSAEDVAAMLDAIPNDDVHYEDWLRIGLALGHATSNGADGLALFHKWSEKSHKYNPAQTERVYRAARHDRENPVTIGTIVHLAKQHGWRPPHSGEDDDKWSDIALARQIAQEWSDNARYIDDMKRWFLWSGVHWKHDARLEHLSRIQDFLVRVSKEHVQSAEASADEDRKKAAKAKRHDLRSAKRRAAVYSEIRPSPHLALQAEQLDNDPWLLGTPGGTVDLRSGKLEPARPEDYITKLAAVAPAERGTKAPIWEAFLKRIFRHAPELIPYMQRLMGYGLTGSVEEQIFAFAWGQGGNGKGVFFHTIGSILKDYAGSAAHNMLLATPNDKHPTDLADLQGRRLVLASEISPGSRWDEAKLKLVTGADPIKARVMRGNFYQYQPSHLLCIFGQHKPSLSSVDEAMRRRIRLIPFTQNIPKEERDPKLMEKLRAEWPAILRWIIDGSLEWQAKGLQTPTTVVTASDNYLKGEDVLGMWLDECCTQKPSDECLLAQLYASWKEWAERNGHHPGSAKVLAGKLRDRGMEDKGSKKGVVFLGVWSAKPDAKNHPF